MCLRNLFGGNDCTWILFIIIVLLLIDNDDCARRGKPCRAFSFIDRRFRYGYNVREKDYHIMAGGIL